MAHHPRRALRAFLAFVLALSGLGVLAAAPQAVAAPGDQTDLVLLLDGSGSIDRRDWALQLDGYAAALQDRVNFPVDGSTAVSVIQWSHRGGTAGNVRVEIPLTVLDSRSAVDSLVEEVLAISQMGNNTNPGDAVIAGTAELVERGRDGATGILCMSTDGARNAGATLPSATAGALAAGIDKFSVVAIADGSFTETAARTAYGPHVFGGGTVTFARTTTEFTTLISGCVADPLHLIALEVTQAVQDLDNTVQLVKGRDTLVRAYLATFDGDEVRATARLRGFAGGRELPQSPLTATNAGGVVVDGNALADRGDLRKTLNFRLPLTWTNEDQLSLELEYAGGVQCVVDALTGPTCRANVALVDAMPLDITYHAVSWEEDGERVGRDWRDLKEQAARVYAQLPVGYGYGYRAGLATGSIHLDERPTITTVNEQLSAARRAAKVPDEHRWYGVLEGRGTGDVGGRAAGYVASGWDANVAGESVAGHARNRVTHEVGHMLGLHHSVNQDQNGQHRQFWKGGAVWTSARGWCGERASVDAPEFPHWRPGLDTKTKTSAALGPMQRARGEVWGTDLRFVGTGGALALSSPHETTSLMSYCSAENTSSQHRWISAHDWAQLLAGDLTPLGVGDADPTGDGAGTLIRATIDEDGTELAPALPVDEAPTADDPDGTHEVVLVDAAGAVLHEIAFTPLEAHDDAVEGEGSTGPSLIVNVVVPADLAGVRTVEIRLDGETLVSGTASAQAPSVSVDPPVTGTPDEVTFAWASEDPDGDELRHTVMYSADDGETWSVVAIDISTTHVDVPRWALAGSSAARLRVLTSDGLRTASATSEAFAMPDLAPWISIDAPDDGVFLSGAQTTVLSASAGDAEDGGSVADGIVWQSDLDGYLDTGATVQRRADTLSEGTHTITATVQDSAGQTASAAITVHVERVVQPVEEPATCSVRYVVHGQWSTGFTSQLWIENVGTETVDGWTLEWEMPQGQSIPDHWSSAVEMTGSTVAATNLGWNARIAPAQEITIGFTGAKPAGDVAATPTSFRLNGGTCASADQ